jgi:hypothetical protein
MAIPDRIQGERPLDDCRRGSILTITHSTQRRNLLNGQANPDRGSKVSVIRLIFGHTVILLHKTEKGGNVLHINAKNFCGKQKFVIANDVCHMYTSFIARLSCFRGKCSGGGWDGLDCLPG